MTNAARLRGRGERGATLVEYALGLSLVAIVALSAIGYLQDRSKDKLDERSTAGAPAEINSLGAGATLPPPTSPPPTAPPPGPATVHIESVTAEATKSTNTWVAKVFVRVLDASGQPRGGVTVTGQWDPSAGGATTCVTDPTTGTCDMSQSEMLRNGPQAVPSVTFTVTSLSGTEITYDSGANATNSITVNQPTN